MVIFSYFPKLWWIMVDKPCSNKSDGYKFGPSDKSWEFRGLTWRFCSGSDTEAKDIGWVPQSPDITQTHSNSLYFIMWTRFQTTVIFIRPFKPPKINRLELMFGVHVFVLHQSIVHLRLNFLLGVSFVNMNICYFA